MSAALLPIIGFGVIVAIILSFWIKPNQTITCPHCQLEFTKDLYTFQDYTLVACRFCHRWMYARSISDRFYAEKIRTRVIGERANPRLSRLILRNNIQADILKITSLMRALRQ